MRSSNGSAPRRTGAGCSTTRTLIDKTLDLLNNVSAAWVHYKLDRGIHHLLIDEAQDTSPKQWAIVKALVSEFFAGAGAHEWQRTIFAVGDEKQSILFVSRSGAARIRQKCDGFFQTSHQDAELKFIATEFKHSFRSGPNILKAVDAVFARVEAHKGLTAPAGSAGARVVAGRSSRPG